MKICAISEHPLNTMGGGERSLARLGWEVALRHPVTLLTSERTLPFSRSLEKNPGLEIFPVDFAGINNGQHQEIQNFIKRIKDTDILYLADKKSLFLIHKLKIKQRFPDMIVVFKESSNGKLFRQVQQFSPQQQKSLLDMLDGVICISTEIELDLSREIQARNLTIVLKKIPNGIDSTVFHPISHHSKQLLRQQFKVASDLPVFLFAGRFADKKNLDIIYGAWWEMENLFGEWAQLILIGKPHKAYDQALIQLMQDHLKRIRIVEPVTLDEELALWYQLSDFYIAPTSREGLSNAFLEACACGLFPIVSTASGYRDVVRNRNAGMLVEERNTSEVIACFKQVYGEVDKYRQKGRTITAEIVRKHFSIKKTALKTIHFFKKLISCRTYT